jgi:NAD(P)-dependent dehydrogenase (short-subunit alcohol dehydrogenase family)
MRELRGKVAVVTGAASGIGKALAQQWVQEGMRVALADWDAHALKAATLELSLQGADVLSCLTDVSNDESMQALADTVFHRYGHVHLVCNNAGILGPESTRLWELSDQEWDRVLSVNFRSVIYGLRAFLPRMLASGEEGHIVTTASMGGFSANSFLPCYISSKHAVVSLCETLRLQLEQLGSNLRSSVLCPGYTRTSLVTRERGLSSEAEGAGAFDNVLSRAGVPQQAMDPRETASIVAEAVRTGKFWIFPNPQSRARIAARIQEILDAARD